MMSWIVNILDDLLASIEIRLNFPEAFSSKGGITILPWRLSTG